jgi:hypothetical protein
MNLRRDIKNDMLAPSVDGGLLEPPNAIDQTENRKYRLILLQRLLFG